MPSWTDEETRTIIKAANHLLSHFDKENPLQPPQTIKNFMTLLREFTDEPVVEDDPRGLAGEILRTALREDAPDLAKEILRIPLEQADLQTMSPVRRARKPRPTRRSRGAA